MFLPPVLVLISILVIMFGGQFLQIDFQINTLVSAVVAGGISFFMAKLHGRPDDNQQVESVNYNQYAENIASSTSRIAIGGANVSHFTDKLTSMFKRQVEHTQQIAGRVEVLESGNQELLNAAQHAQKSIEQSDKETNRSNELLQEAMQQQTSLNEQISVSTESLGNLKIKADSIGHIVTTINQLADQTNMLALNAAIEAARAGEQGRGFAVVADEVRELAKKTTDATRSIETVLEEISFATGDSVKAIDAVSVSGQKMANLVNETSAVVSKSSHSAYEAKAAMEQVHRTVKEHNETNQGISQNVRDLYGSTQELEDDLAEVSKKVLNLCNQTEDIFRQLQVFSLENRNSVIRDIALQAAANVGDIFADAIVSGQIAEHALFDSQYKEVPNTNPQKYTTLFDKFTDQVLPTIQESILQGHTYIIYAGAVDRKGYFPTHNKKFSKAMTGNYDQDLANSRTKRIFDDYTGARCGSNTQSFLLQTYKRDTGEVMHDLSAPIYVNGKHWGGFRIGYQAQQ